MQNNPKNLDEWIELQLGLYQDEIGLGLERVKKVAGNLKLLKPKFKIISVGGTNGKGSTVTLAESILRNAGFRTGSFTSPHLLEYTERIKINNQKITQTEAIEHFEMIEKARGETKVTYFEFSALAAMLSFIKHKADVAILEVGLGGRLDATNIWDADAAIVTNIGIDHQKWLGDTKDEIAEEKAGIFKKDKLAIIGDSNAPAVLSAKAREVGAILRRYNQDFFIEIKDNIWSLQYQDKILPSLAPPGLKGEFQFINSACAILAVLGLDLNVDIGSINQGLARARIAGRLQDFSNKNRNWLLDVAHNFDSARALANYLEKNQIRGKTIALFSMLKDKELSKVINLMQKQIDKWYVLELKTGRAEDVRTIQTAIHNIASKRATVYNDAILAVKDIIINSSQQDRIVVFGSFYTVGAIMELGIDNSV